LRDYERGVGHFFGDVNGGIRPENAVERVDLIQQYGRGNGPAGLVSKLEKHLVSGGFGREDPEGDNDH
jgi:hypothetical protein